MLQVVALTSKTKTKPTKSVYELDHIIYQKLFKPRKDVSWQQVVYMDPCSYCGRKNQSRPSQEHVLPAKNGGTTRWDNIVGACRECNMNRSSMPLLKYLVSRNHELSIM